MKTSFRDAIRRMRRFIRRVSVWNLLQNLNDARAVRQRYGRRVRWVAFDESFEENLSDRWRFTEEASPRLTVVVATFHQSLALDCLLTSLVCQTLQNFKVLVIHDGPDANTCDVVDRYIRAHPTKFEYVQTDARYGDFGHSLRQIGIDRTDTEFILLTNGDNYYAPRFVEFMFSGIDKHGLDIILCDMVHSHRNPGARIQASYSFFRTLPLRNYVDIGCFIARTSMARKVGFRDKSFSGDAIYFEDLLGSAERVSVGKIGKILLVHN